MFVKNSMKHVLGELGISSENFRYDPYYTAVAEPAEGRQARIVLTPPRYGASSAALAYATALESGLVSRYCRTLMVVASGVIAESVRRRAAKVSLLRKEIPDSEELERTPFKVVSAEEYGDGLRDGVEFYNIIVDGPECLSDDVVDKLAEAASENTDVLVVGTLNKESADGVLALRTYGFDITAFPGLTSSPRGCLTSFDSERFSTDSLKKLANLDPKRFNVTYQHKPVWGALQPANRALCRSGAVSE